MIVQLLLLQIIICFIIDLSGIIQSIESGLGRWLKCKITIPRPFSCSLCMGWWLGLLFIIITGHFTLPYIAIVAGFSFFSKNITGFIRWVSDLLIKIEDILYKIIR